MSERYYVCKRRPNEAYQCVNIYSGKIKSAVENKIPYRCDKGDYRIAFLIPGINTIYGNDQTELRREAIRLCEEWFKSANWKQ